MYNKKVEKAGGYQLVLFVIILVSTYARMQMFMYPSSLMPLISDSLGVNYAQAGAMITVITVMTGVALFAGSYVIDRVGVSRIVMLSCLCLIPEAVIAVCGGGFIPIMAARVFTGAGQGLATGAVPALISDRYSDRMQTWVYSIFTAVTSASTALTHATAAEITGALPGWRFYPLIWGAVSLAAAVVFWQVEKSHGKFTEIKRGSDIKIESSLSKVVKMRTVWCLAIAQAGIGVIQMFYYSYLPSFFTEQYGITLAQSGLITSLLSIAGIVGSMLGGSFQNVKNKKRMMIFINCMIFVLSMCLLNVPYSVLTVVSVSLVGLGMYCLNPLQISIFMKDPAIKPDMMGAAMAMYHGLGSFLTLLQPVLFGILYPQIGFKNTMISFSMLLIVPIVSVLSLRTDRAEKADAKS